MSPFRACGVTGFACACALALVLAGAREISLTVQASLIAAAVAVFFALALATKRLLGHEALIYYHHEIAVLSVVAGVAATVGAPVLPHLDATALGLGAFLVCGRIGCLLAGCCHGRPATPGIRYREEHMRAGLPAFLVGVPLIPVQALEAAGVAALVAVGAALDLGGARDGTPLTVYVTGYAVLRFGLEWLRGDLQRPVWHGVTEAQWTSLALTALIVAGGAAGALPTASWHVAALAVLTAAAGAAACGWLPRSRNLLAPTSVRETAACLDALRPLATIGVTLRATHAGLRLSCGSTGAALHYAMSRDAPALTDEEASRVARLILWLTDRRAQGAVVRGPAGVFHLVLDERLPASTSRSRLSEQHGNPGQRTSRTSRPPASSPAPPSSPRMRAT